METSIIVSSIIGTAIIFLFVGFFIGLLVGDDIDQQKTKR